MYAPQTDPDTARLNGAPTPGPAGVRGPGAPQNPQLPNRTPGTKGINDAAAKENGAKVDKGACINHDAVKFPRQSAIDAIKEHEGYYNFMYLDSQSIITIGAGWNLEASGSASAPSAEVLALPFLERKTSKAPADSDKSIKAAWAALRALSPSGTKQNYAAPYFKDKTDLYIDDSKPDNPLMTRFNKHIADFTAQLQRMFKDFDSFPVPAREAFLDMAFNMGVGRAAVAAVKADPKHHKKGHKGHKATGLHQFKSLIAAAEKADWKSAADDCKRGGVNADRNTWTRNLFLEAVGWACAKAG